MADPGALSTPLRDVIGMISGAVAEEKVNSADELSAISNRDDILLDVNQQLQTLIATISSQQTLLLSLGSKVQALEAASPQLSTGTNNNNNNNVASSSGGGTASNFREAKAFSGGTPIKRDSVPTLPLACRDPKIAAHVQQCCQKGVSTTYKFDGSSDNILRFMSLLNSKCMEMGMTEALWAENSDGTHVNLTESWTSMTVADVRAYEARVRKDSPTDRLLTEWSFLRILLLNSVDEKVHDSLCTNARSSDLGPTLLRQLLQQAGGSHTITIENYERTFKQTKLTAIDGCNMQTYADHIVPVINSLHRLRRFPLNATKTMLENTAGTHNESFQMIRTTALADPRYFCRRSAFTGQP